MSPVTQLTSEGLSKESRWLPSTLRHQSSSSRQPVLKYWLLVSRSWICWLLMPVVERLVSSVAPASARRYLFRNSLYVFPNIPLRHILRGGDRHVNDKRNTDSNRITLPRPTVVILCSPVSESERVKEMTCTMRCRRPR